MVVVLMLLSGVVVGLVGLFELFGKIYIYDLLFLVGFGFIGIAIVLVGCNLFVGVVVVVLLFVYLDVVSNFL